MDVCFLILAITDDRENADRCAAVQAERNAMQEFQEID